MNLRKLGHAVDKDTVAKYMPKPARRPRRPPSQTWKTFLRNHLAGTIAIDFLTVPTVTFNVLYVFFVLSLERRRVLHVNVTAHPYAAWAAQQIVEAIGAEIVPARLVRDRDAIFGTEFDARVDNLGIRQIRISPRSPWQNGYAERWVGTLRRELLDHLIVLGERHLLRLVRAACRLLQRGPTAHVARSATRRSRAPSNRRAVAGSSPFRASAGSTTVTRGLHDHSASVFRQHRSRTRPCDSCQAVNSFRTSSAWIYW